MDVFIKRYMDVLERPRKHKLSNWIRETMLSSYLNLKITGHHLDSTSFHSDGTYKTNDMDDNGIQLVNGYSRDHRPDLNQAVLNLIVENLRLSLGAI